jgi:hypothetical protein
VVGVGLFVLGLAGLSPFPPSSPFTENLLHLGTGSLYVGGGLLVDDLPHLRAFVGGMGVLLVLGKLVIVGGRWLEESFQVPLVGVVCAIVGISSLLVAAFVGGESPPG